MTELFFGDCSSALASGKTSDWSVLTGNISGMFIGVGGGGGWGKGYFLVIG